MPLLDELLSFSEDQYQRELRMHPTWPCKKVRSTGSEGRVRVCAERCLQPPALDRFPGHVRRVCTSILPPTLAYILSNQGKPSPSYPWLFQVSCCGVFSGPKTVVAYQLLTVALLLQVCQFLPHQELPGLHSAHDAGGQGPGPRHDGRRRADLHPASRLRILQVPQWRPGRSHLTQNPPSR